MSNRPTQPLPPSGASGVTTCMRQGGAPAGASARNIAGPATAEWPITRVAGERRSDRLSRRASRGRLWDADVTGAVRPVTMARVAFCFFARFLFITFGRNNTFSLACGLPRARRKKENIKQNTIAPNQGWEKEGRKENRQAERGTKEGWEMRNQKSLKFLLHDRRHRNPSRYSAQLCATGARF